MRRRPPHLGGQPQAQVTQRLDGTGEQQGLAQRDDLGLEALLTRLSEKSLGVRRNHHARDNLHTSPFKGRYLRGKVLRSALKTPRIGERKTHVGQRLGETQLLVAPGIAIAVVGEQTAHLLVGLHALPALGIGGDHVFQAPEDVIRPVKTGLRIAIAPKEPGLPRHHAGDAWHLVELAGIADWVRRFRRASGQHECHLVLQDQVVGHLARTVGVGLTVLEHDLHRVLGAAHGDAVLERRAHLLDHPFVGLAKRRERAGLRRHIADLERRCCPQQRRGGCGGQCSCRLRELSAIHAHVGLLLMYSGYSGITAIQAGGPERR
ncbi:hypothetical protein SDC9_126151 [bioreactor metagenome]|uniref:Uncharacterized protein n=1 Tax=bioreactor metagenome TaxID=1076179 RepID=A0A645CPU7_9ZZZZ